MGTYQSVFNDDECALGVPVWRARVRLRISRARAALFRDRMATMCPSGEALGPHLQFRDAARTGRYGSLRSFERHQRFSICNIALT